MDFLTLWSLLGFLFAVYAVTANDSIQTLGTYISSNNDIKWYWMFAYMGSIFLITMLEGFNVGDPAFGRLDNFPEIDIQWYHAVAPLVLVALTRLKIPVSTTFLVLSVFASSVVMEKMLLKSFLGYAVSFVFAWGSWYLISKYFLNEGEKGKNKYNNYWRIGQWVTTGWLWSTWLKHDLANIMVFLPRYSNLENTYFEFFVIGTMLLGLAFMFYERGGRIQEIVLSKTNTRYVRSATLIDLVYCFVLYYFKEVNNIPMSTTFVFMGMLAGRELGIWMSIGYGELTYTSRHKKAIFPMLYKDFLRLMLGLMISVSLAYGIQWYSAL
jgi:hypothetical protein|tara:strand:+ start:1278 stop:2252 length:975 start_codon:yes stop_codon:yes gene_type:complete